MTTVNQITTYKHKLLYQVSKKVATHLNEVNWQGQTERLYHTLVIMLEQMIDRLAVSRMRVAVWNVLGTEKISCEYELGACLNELCYNSVSSSSYLIDIIVSYIVEKKKEDPAEFFRKCVVEFTAIWLDERGEHIGHDDPITETDIYSLLLHEPETRKLVQAMLITRGILKPSAEPVEDVKGNQPEQLELFDQGA